mmetsp:Transcript_1189/g.5030  ORF Transcript_1189/g.5030 Transcript_1189/m.5030 type:complete len:260 (+) Transcript_1189:59-838(+)
MRHLRLMRRLYLRRTGRRLGQRTQLRAQLGFQVRHERKSLPDVEAFAPRSSVPEDFGALNGSPVSNKESILAEVDLAIARLSNAGATSGRPPDVEVLFTEHKAYRGNLLGWIAHHLLFRFGHGLIRYTLPDGRQFCMNILGGEGLHLPGGQLVNLSNPQDYLYGTYHYDTGNQQGGLYNGAMVGVRIEKAPSGATEALHAYFMALDKRSRVGDRVAGPGSRGAIAQFQLLGGRTLSWMQENFPRLRSARFQSVSRAAAH